MHSLSIVQKNHAQVFAISLLNSHPPSNSAILLDGFFDRIRYCSFNPFYLDIFPVWANTHRLEVLRKFHICNVTVGQR